LNQENKAKEGFFSQGDKMRDRKGFKEKLISEMKDFFKQRALEYHIDVAFLYGSWARGYPKQDSDVDLALLFSPEISNQDKIFFLISDISYKLGKQLNKEINIISISRDFRHPMLYYNAIISGIPLFVKDYDRFLSLKLEAIYQAEDFELFGVRWQQEIAKRLIYQT